MDDDDDDDGDFLLTVGRDPSERSSETADAEAINKSENGSALDAAAADDDNEEEDEDDDFGA